MLAGPGGLIQPMRMTPRKAQSARADAKRKSAHGAVAAELCEIYIMRVRFLVDDGMEISCWTAQAN
jgi:hypothetical protein